MSGVLQCVARVETRLVGIFYLFARNHVPSLRRRPCTRNHRRFDEHLDLRPFLSVSRDQSDLLLDSSSLPDDAFHYSLFAVVNHKGDLQLGHYTCFVKLAQPGSQWFCCDDETVASASVHEVLNSEAYMLFYIKNRLEYQAD
eukprot:m.586785 g.586785  ORF g.586785 m.586785 type:complete len:142 (-) comp57979_c0_seq28:62-487(-)